MFLGFFIRAVINTVILLAAMHIVSRRGSKPEFAEVFYVSVGISFVSVMLTFLLFADIGYLVLVPIFAASILILMKFLGMSLLTAIAVLIVFHVINYFLPI